MSCQIRISFIQSVVDVVIYRIVRFEARFPFCREFFGNNGIRILIYLITENREVFMLDNTGKRHVTVRIIDYGISLEVRNVQRLRFKG